MGLWMIHAYDGDSFTKQVMNQKKMIDEVSIVSSIGKMKYQ